jgi:hypothetical protein
MDFVNEKQGPKLPEPLGLVASFGYGDRLGSATPGHYRAHLRGGFAPIFAQQSIREMARTGRQPEDVMNCAKAALLEVDYTGIWGADADHLKTEEDVQRTAAAGFTFFTIDPSEHVVNEADGMDAASLETRVGQQNADGLYGGSSLESLYLGKSWEVGKETYRFDREQLLRASVKYGYAVAHAEEMRAYIANAMAGRPYEIEVSVDETDSPTSILEHLFFALELKRRGVQVVSLAPRFIGEFEKGIDYKGDLVTFESALEAHVAVAKTFGPYKISIHSGSDKFSIYPIIGRVCGELLHVKTAGTSYLEALRVVARQDPVLFAEIIAYGGTRFNQDKVSYHISVQDNDVPGLMATIASDREKVFLDENHGRQLLHVTFGSVLTCGLRPNGQSFKEAINLVLENEKDLHAEFLERHLGKHLDQLRAG